jgi:hypothetical protein
LGAPDNVHHDDAKDEKRHEQPFDEQNRNPQGVSLIEPTDSDKANKAHKGVNPGTNKERSQH